MEKSKALVVKEKNVLEFVDLEKPEARDYEVLVKVKACSLCTLDRRVYLGTRSRQFPFLGGHEVSGIAEKCGYGVVGIKEGDKVILTSAYCNQCELDRTGRGTQCMNKAKEPQRIKFDGFIQGGGLSEYISVPAWQLIRIDEKADLDHAALTEPLACCVHSISKARIKFGDTVVIIGMGIMGYFHLKLALMQGARVIVSEMDETRKQKALESGAHVVIDPGQQDLAEEVRKLTNGLGADVVVNTIPSLSVWNSAIDTLAPYGRLIAYSSQDSKEPVGVDFGKVHSREIEFIGTLNPTIEDNERAVRLITYGMIDMEEVIDARFPFEQGKEAFEAALKPGAYRVIINY